MSSALLSLNPVKAPNAARTGKQVAGYRVKGRTLGLRTVAMANWGTVKGREDIKTKDQAWLSGHADAARSSFSKLESDVKIPQAPRFAAVLIAGVLVYLVFQGVTS